MVTCSLANSADHLLYVPICHAALLSLVTSKDRDQLQIPATSDVEVIEKTLNLSSPAVVVKNTVASDGDTLAVAVAILPTLQTLLPSNLSG